MPLDEAYEAIDWSACGTMPAFEAARRVNACNQYPWLERETD